MFAIRAEPTGHEAPLMEYEYSFNCPTPECKKEFIFMAVPAVLDISQTLLGS